MHVSVWTCVSAVTRARVGIILVLISNSVAPSPFTDKLRYLAASDASTAVMNDAPWINAAPLLLPLLQNTASLNKIYVLKETSLYQAIISSTLSQTNQITDPTPHILQDPEWSEDKLQNLQLCWSYKDFQIALPLPKSNSNPNLNTKAAVVNSSDGGREVIIINESL